MLTYLFAGTMSILPATIITASVSIVLTALGGLYSVVWTDTIQFVIMVLVIVVAAPIIGVKNAGSLTVIEQKLAQVGGTLLNPTKNVPFSYILLSLVTCILSIPCDPTIPQRVLVGNDTKTTRKAFNISAVICLVFGFALVIIGGSAAVLMPDIAAEYGTTEAAFPMLIIRYFPAGFSGISISVLIATIITTITSMLLVGTTHLVYDMGQSVFPRVSDETFKRIMPVAIVLLGGLSVWISLRVGSVTSVLYFAFSLCGAAFMFPIIAVLYWKKVSKWGITLGVAGGMLTVLIQNFAGYSGPGGDPVYLGLLVSLVFTVGASLLIPGGGIGKDE